jgi:hypothetical protein
MERPIIELEPWEYEWVAHVGARRCIENWNKPDVRKVEICGWISYDKGWTLATPSDYDPENTRLLPPHASETQSITGGPMSEFDPKTITNLDIAAWERSGCLR